MSQQKNENSEKVDLPAGFKAAGLHAGIKKWGKKDMALIVSEAPAAVAGTLTTNQVKAASVKLCRERLAGGQARAIIINSGNANAATGERGVRDAKRMAEVAAEGLGVDPETVFVCSTGTIGRPLPMDVVEAGIRKIAACAAEDGGPDAAEAILTTDTCMKHCTAELRIDGKPVRVTGMAKGSGMIEPRMATMLAFLLTDAAVAPAALQECLSDAVNRSFNRITVDGDMSTNDTVLFMANGAAGHAELEAQHADWPAFCEAVNSVTLDLALKIVGDGEGATRKVTICVRGAASAEDAELAARAVANSLLLKTSWAGTYPNWGRVLDALGYSSAVVEEERIDVDYDDVPAVRAGVAAGAPLEDLQKIVGADAFNINIDLHLGDGEAVVYTCDCTEEYVRINM